MLVLLYLVNFILPLVKPNRLLVVERLEVLQRLRPVPYRNGPTPSFNASERMELFLSERILLNFLLVLINVGDKFFVK